MDTRGSRGGEVVADRWTGVARQAVEARGPTALQIDDLQPADLAELLWAGGATHVMHVSRELARVEAGEVDYLVVRAPRSGRPVAAGAVERANPPAAAKLMQIVTHPDLRCLGIGSYLIGALEDRARAGAHRAVALCVELTNERARLLYKRLGYWQYGFENTGWEQEDPDGHVYWHATRCALMRKSL